MFPRSIHIVIAVVAFLAAAFSVRGLIGRSGILDHSRSVAGAKSSLNIQFVDIVP
jgi:hypothetical protein